MSPLLKLSLFNKLYFAQFNCNAREGDLQD